MRIGIFILCFSLSCKLVAQNLVPNADFELHDSCPYDQDQLHFASGWFKPTANSTDYYNACAIVSSLDVPTNFLGSQPAHSGNGYGGAGFFVTNNTREYLSTTLIDTLQTERTYCVEFWVAVADSSWDGIASIGMYFSDTFINDQSTISYLPLQPQIVSAPLVPIVDTVNWTRVSGLLSAQGGEKYIIIGNFQPDSLVVSDTIRPHSNFYFTYCYIDDVSVYEISNCISGNNTTICYRDSIQLGVPPLPNVVYTWLPVDGLSNANISNPTASPDTSITYTLTQIECDAVSTSSVTVTVDHGCHSAPTIIIPSILFGDQNLFVSGLESNSKMELFDERGRLVFTQEDYQNGFWSTNLAQGMYVARLTRPNGETVQQKVGVVK